MIEETWFRQLIDTAAIDPTDRAATEHKDQIATAILVRNLLLQAQRRGKVSRDNLADFLLTVGRYAHLSKSQIVQDLWVVFETFEKKGGYFVEFGALDGIRYSNTWILEKAFGWNGILAEPHPMFHESLRRNRTCYTTSKCVHWMSGQIVPFMAVGSNPELSRISSIDPGDKQEAAGMRSNYGEVQVETISLNDLLREANAPREIDYLSIDTEGSEYEILRALDFDHWKIRLISVEHNRTPKRQAIFELLRDQNYIRKWQHLSQVDDWYLREDP